MILANVIYARSFELPEISNKTEFYMIACEPGQETYTLFGHAAIRVVDPIQGLDVSFNWGVFSFDAPNFIGRFVVGQTDYELAVWPTNSFLAEYRERGSAVHQCHINLDSIEKQRLWTLMCKNYQPENRVYRYNFIYDNCATRVVDMILASYDTISSPSFDLPTMSYRKFVSTYTHTDRWISVGIDLVFGREADKVVTAKQSTTFPLQAMQLLLGAKVVRDSVAEPILTDHIFLCNPDKFGAWREQSKFGTILMCILPLAILALYIFLFFWRKKYHFEQISTQIILWLLFILSLLLIFLKHFTIHPLVDFNLNILWCNPITGVLAVMLLFRHRAFLSKVYVSFLTFILTFAYLFVLANDIQCMAGPLFCWWIMVLGVELIILFTYLPRYITHIKHKFKKHKHHHHHHRHHHHHHHHHHEEE